MAAFTDGLAVLSLIIMFIQLCRSAGVLGGGGCRLGSRLGAHQTAIEPKRNVLEVGVY